jgi:hypothetical protein
MSAPVTKLKVSSWGASQTSNGSIHPAYGGLQVAVAADGIWKQ